MAMCDLILASNSPRRYELLGLLGLTFRVSPADIDEQQQPGEPPLSYVRRMACEKARSISSDQPGLVVAADTIVVESGELLGKPADMDEAKQMLQRLRGRVHQVYTHIAIIKPVTGQDYDTVCGTEVPMRDYADDEIEAYVATGDPLDKAGGYGIQHAGFHPVENLHGCFASVMGLPLCHLAVGLGHFAVNVTLGLPERCQVYLNYNCPVYHAILRSA